MQSPFYLMMGYEPCALPLVISDTTIPTVETCLKTLAAAHDEALAAHELARQVMAAPYTSLLLPIQTRRQGLVRSQKP